VRLPEEIKKRETHLFTVRGTTGRAKKTGADASGRTKGLTSYRISEFKRSSRTAMFVARLGLRGSGAGPWCRTLKFRGRVRSCVSDGLMNRNKKKHRSNIKYRPSRNLRMRVNQSEIRKLKNILTARNASEDDRRRMGKRRQRLLCGQEINGVGKGELS